MGILSLIPSRVYEYGAILLICALAYGIWDHHERAIGAQKVEAADARTAAIQVKHDEDVQNAAKTAGEKALADYVAAHAVPTLPSVGIVCRRAAPSSGTVPSATSPASGSDAAASLPTEVEGPPFNPAPAVLADGRDADAQIVLLQALIRSYQAAGVVAKE